MSNELIGIIGITLLIILILLKFSVGLSLLLVSFVGLALLNNWDSALTQLSSSAFSTVNNYSLSVIPLFILMGMFMSNSGLGKDLFNAVDKWIGHLRGGLALATIGASAIFSAISGSANATTATLTKICIPEMDKYNYKTTFSTSAVAAGGTLGSLIPPSVLLILYGILTNESIGKLLIAGIVPGIFMAILFMILINVQVRINPSIAPNRKESVSWKEKLDSLSSIWPFLLIFLLSIGGIYFGFFTPSEAGGVGAAGALIISLLMKRMDFPLIVKSLEETISITAMIFLVLIGASLFNRFLALSRIPMSLSNTIADLTLSPIMIMLLILLILLVLGMFLEAIAIMTLTLPIIYPLITELGFNGIWFGIIMVLIINIGVLTPPLGISVFIISGIVKEVPVEKIFRGVIPAIIVMLIFVGILLIFPEIAIFLPDLTG